MALSPLTQTGSKAGTYHAVYARPSGGLFQTLGMIVNGMIDLPDYEENDSMNRNRAHASQVLANFDMQQASLIELELLDTLCAGGIDFLFRTSQAVSIPTTPTAAAGWILLTAAEIGAIKPKLDFKGGMSTKRRINIDLSGSLTFTEHAAAVKPTIDESMFESSAETGTFHTLGTYTVLHDGGAPIASHGVANGIASITLADVAGGDPVSLGTVNNFNAVFEYLSDTEADELKRHECTTIKVNVTYDMRSTDAATLLLLKEMSNKSINAVITFRSGLIATLTNEVGISTNYSIPTTIDKNSVVKFKHSGSILSTSLDAVLSGS